MTDPTPPLADALLTLWDGGGTMGARMGAFDWSASSVGPPGGWPPALRSAMSICLLSRYPIAIYWGPDLVVLYNDAWSPILGDKHPWALGRAGQEVWPEIWDRLTPLFDRVMRAGEGIWQEDELLLMRRHGYTEECYFNFTFSPILGDAGAVGGVFNAVVETTYRVVGERRMRALRQLTERTTTVRTMEEVWSAAAAALEGAAADVPFALLYALEHEGTTARLRASAGIPAGTPVTPAEVRLAEPGGTVWPLERVARTGQAERMDDLAGLGPLPGGPWGDPANAALVLPVAGAGHDRPFGILVAGISPRRALDEEYRGFFDLVAGQIGTAIANARSYEAERRRAEALAELDRAKTTFFSNVSHEFRTPLTLLLAPVEDALRDQDGALAPAHRERLELVHRNGLRLLKLVNTLLDFARLEAGRIEAAFQPTDLAAVTAELAGAFRAALTRAGLELVVDTPPLPAPVYVDRDMWEKIVLNLLSNAFKFTHAGSIAVRLHPAGGQVELEVTDTGIGIPPAELPHLFERFHRVKGAQGRTHEGTGIGLALVQELVRIHGGGVTVTSEPGKGTTFLVHLPAGSDHLPHDRIGPARAAEPAVLGAAPFVEEAARWIGGDDPVPPADGGAAAVELLGPRTDSAEPAAARGRDGGLPRVLLADDNADMREYIARLLTTRWRVTAVADGQAALEAALADPPDLVLTDVMMPRLDGLGLLRALRADDRTSALPVLLLSARAGEDASLEGLAGGADDYLTKPFTARELLARVGAHLAVAQTRREALAREAAARAEVERAVARLNFALEATRTVAFEWDLVAGVTEYSRSAESVLGIPSGRTADRSDIVHPDDRERVEDVLAQAFASQPVVDTEFRIVRPDTGEVRWIHMTGVVTRDAGGRAVRATGVGRDVTERRAAELQAQAAQRLDAVGQLAGGVAHEVNNALTGVLGFAHLALRRLAERDPVRDDLEQIIRSGDRAAGVARQLLAYSRRQLLKPQRFDLAPMIQEFEPMLRQALGPERELRLDLTAPAWINADRAQIEQVLLNLVLNARDAMPSGGRVAVTVAIEHVSGGAERRTPAGIVIPPGSYAMLAVSDTGVGMDRATRARLFEPFFTTKPVGQGTGLGLATVYGIVRQSGGYIWVYSEPGEGTTVRVALPLLAPARPPASPGTASPPGGGRRERVLVVDDEPVVLGVLERLLDDAGYTVLTAGSALEGLAALRRGSGAVELVLTDLVMPGMGGRDLAARIEAEHPGTPVLFMSGYTNDEGVRRGILSEGAAFVPKPLNMDQLLTAVRELLNAKAAAPPASP